MAVEICKSKVNVSIPLDASIQGIQEMHRIDNPRSLLNSLQFAMHQHISSRASKSHKLCLVGNVNECERNGKSGETVAGKTERMHAWILQSAEEDRKCARTNYRQISHGNCN